MSANKAVIKKVTTMVPFTPSSKTVTTVTSSKRAKGKRRKSRKPARSGTGSGAREWVMSLNDPFRHQGIRYGYGTLAETDTHTLYYRGTLTVQSSGSVALMALPSAFNLSTSPTSVAASWNSLMFCAGTDPALWAGLQWPNMNGIQAVVNRMRCISAGMRAFAELPGTSVPGMFYSGCIEGMVWENAQGPNNQAVFNDTSIATGNGPNLNFLAQYPVFRMSNGRHGAVALSRPQDAQAEEFQVLAQNVNKIGSTAGQASWSLPTIIYAGPVGTVVHFEAVVNFEAIAPPFNFGSLDDQLGATNSANAEPTVMDSFPSFTQAWRTVRTLLSDPAVSNVAGIVLDDAANGRLSSSTLFNAFATGEAARRAANRAGRMDRTLMP